MRHFTLTLGGHRATLTVYVQEPSEELSNAKVRPAVLVLPGGGYKYTSDREAEPVALAYSAQGFNTFVLRYAVSDDASFTMASSDAEDALAWIRDHAAELHVDPAKVVVVGFSAGGHLAGYLGTIAANKPDALVLGYPVTLEEKGRQLGKDIPDIPSHVTAQTPPTFLFSTCSDEVVPIRHSVDLLAALAGKGVPFESHIYLLGRHGLSLSNSSTADGRSDFVEPSVVGWFGDSVRFLRTVLGDFDVEGASAVFQRES